jgi:hypothetical protein
MPQSAQTHQIAHLNDQFRKTFLGGKVMLTQGINTLPEKEKREILQAVQAFNDFTPENDPYAEHDFGTIEYYGQCIFWKISYYDPSLTYGSEDPSNPAITTRVLTIMLAGEY